MKTLIKNLLYRFGYEINRVGSSNPTSPIADLSRDEQQIVSRVMPFTMTSVERIAAAINAVRYVTTNNIPGDIAECGVWRGGSMMTIALCLLAYGDTTRSLYLYDTYHGMVSPTKDDKRWDGVSARSEFERETKDDGKWCYASLEEVRKNMFSTGYPGNKIHFVEGKVEDTIPRIVPPHLSLLRLDTDWYESTKHELTHLFPLLDSRGVLIVDDYGCWQGAQKAVDEYFREKGRIVFLHRVDNTGRILVGNGA